MRYRIQVKPLPYVMMLLVAMAGPGLAQDSAAVSSLRSQIDDIVAPYLTAADFMGVVAVQRDGEEPLILPYGLASAELEVPHRALDIFLIGSISKQFTAAAILLLEQDGLLSTDDLVSEHLPGFAHGDRVTIEQLLTHTSGIADIFSLPRFGATAGQAGTFQELIDDLGRVELTYTPGSSYAYSNGGYAVLAAIIESASGTTYGEYLERRIFEPLGMSSTAHDGPGPVAKDRVPGYDPWGPYELTTASPISPAFSTGSGSLWSSAADLLTWTSALHDGRVLSDSAYQRLTRDYGYGYGYGVSVFDRFDRAVIGHDGRIDGFASDLARYIEDRLTVVILSNVQSVARDEIRRSVAAAALGEPYSIPRPRQFVERPNSALDELIGVYSFGPGLEVSISVRDGRLLARANQGGYSELVAVSETEWFSRVLYATVRFGRDEAGAVDRLIWGRGERAPVGRRIR